MKEKCTNCNPYGYVYEEINEQTMTYHTCPKCYGTKQIVSPLSKILNFIAARITPRGFRLTMGSTQVE